MKKLCGYVSFGELCQIFSRLGFSSGDLLDHLFKKGEESREVRMTPSSSFKYG